MRNIRRTLKTVLVSVLCLLLLLNSVMTPAVFSEGEDPEDPVEAVEALLEGIDSLQDMQNKRSDFTVSAAYNPDDAASVAEHETAQADYNDRY